MDHLQRAAHPEQDPQRRDKYVNNATKLTRGFAQAVEAPLDLLQLLPGLAMFGRGVEPALQLLFADVPVAQAFHRCVGELLYPGLRIGTGREIPSVRKPRLGSSVLLQRVRGIIF